MYCIHHVWIIFREMSSTDAKQSQSLSFILILNNAPTLIFTVLNRLPQKQDNYNIHSLWVFSSKSKLHLNFLIWYKMFIFQKIFLTSGAIFTKSQPKIGSRLSVRCLFFGVTFFHRGKQQEKTIEIPFFWFKYIPYIIIE